MSAPRRPPGFFDNSVDNNYDYDGYNDDYDDYDQSDDLFSHIDDSPPYSPSFQSYERPPGFDKPISENQDIEVSSDPQIDQILPFDQSSDHFEKPTEESNIQIPPPLVAVVKTELPPCKVSSFWDDTSSSDSNIEIQPQSDSRESTQSKDISSNAGNKNQKPKDKKGSDKGQKEAGKKKKTNLINPAQISQGSFYSTTLDRTSIPLLPDSIALKGPAIDVNSTVTGSLPVQSPAVIPLSPFNLVTAPTEQQQPPTISPFNVVTAPMPQQTSQVEQPEPVEQTSQVEQQQPITLNPATIVSAPMSQPTEPVEQTSLAEETSLSEVTMPSEQISQVEETEQIMQQQPQNAVKPEQQRPVALSPLNLVSAPMPQQSSEAETTFNSAPLIESNTEAALPFTQAGVQAEATSGENSEELKQAINLETALNDPSLIERLAKLNKKTPKQIVAMIKSLKKTPALQNPMAQPANTQPANTQPANTQPANTQPTNTKPILVESAHNAMTVYYANCQTVYFITLNPFTVSKADYDGPIIGAVPVASNKWYILTEECAYIRDQMNSYTVPTIFPNNTKSLLADPANINCIFGLTSNGQLLYSTLSPETITLLPLSDIQAFAASKNCYMYVTMDRTVIWKNRFFEKCATISFTIPSQLSQYRLFCGDDYAYLYDYTQGILYDIIQNEIYNKLCVFHVISAASFIACPPQSQRTAIGTVISLIKKKYEEGSGKGSDQSKSIQESIEQLTSLTNKMESDLLTVHNAQQERFNSLVEQSAEQAFVTLNKNKQQAKESMTVDQWYETTLSEHPSLVKNAIKKNKLSDITPVLDNLHPSVIIHLILISIDILKENPRSINPLACNLFYTLMKLNMNNFIVKSSVISICPYIETVFRDLYKQVQPHTKESAVINSIIHYSRAFNTSEKKQG